MSPPAVRVNDLAWMIGGPQGSGVDSSANVFARACAAGGLHIFGKREFYSNIMGEHSYFALRAHSGLVRSHIDDVNVLATFEAETLFRHAREVTDDGAIIYDPSLGKTRLSDVPTIEQRLAADLKTYIISRRPSCRSSHTGSRSSRGRSRGCSSRAARRPPSGSCTAECVSRRTTRSPPRPTRASSSRRTRSST